MKTWFISDTHFNHLNIIKLSNRPFNSIEEMNAAIVANWNSVVGPEDTVYHIGDFAMGDRSLIPGIFKQLNGETILIRGNHDFRKGATEPKLLECNFVNFLDEIIIKIEGRLIYMRHIPNLDYKLIDNEIDFHICGHVHESWTRQGNILNAGVDVNGFKPVSLQTLINMPEIKGNGHRGY